MSNEYDDDGEIVDAEVLDENGNSAGEVESILEAWGDVDDIQEAPGISPGNAKRPTNKRLHAKEKERRAVAMRLGGYTYQQIADALGYSSRSAAYAVVQRAMDNAHMDTVKMHKQLQVSRYEFMLGLLWPQVAMKDPGAMQQALAVMDRLERLLGLQQLREDGDVGNLSTPQTIIASGDKEEFMRAMQAYRELTSGTPQDDLEGRPDEEELELEDGDEPSGAAEDAGVAD